MLTLNEYCRKKFGEKLYKISLNGGFTCPNRDGKAGTGGCIFCSAGGSGDFAADAGMPVDAQIEFAKKRLGEKGEGLKYIAYFQSFTGTYGDIDALFAMYKEAAEREDIVGLSIATRPDCLGEKELNMLECLREIKPLWVELGLQTVHADTAKYINRGYDLCVYDRAMEDLAKLDVHRITHVILGLPGEDRERMLETVRYAGAKTDGIKLQLLHVLRGTRLADEYAAGAFKAMEPQEYYDTVADALEILGEDIVIHRLTGDGAKKDLIAPTWSADKKRVLADLNRTLRARGIFPAER